MGRTAPGEEGQLSSMNFSTICYEVQNARIAARTNASRVFGGKEAYYPMLEAVGR